MIDVRVPSGQIANRRARVRSAEDAVAAMEIRGIPVEAYVIYRIGTGYSIYWFQPSVSTPIEAARDERAGEARATPNGTGTDPSWYGR